MSCPGGRPRSRGKSKLSSDGCQPQFLQEQHFLFESVASFLFLAFQCRTSLEIVTTKGLMEIKLQGGMCYNTGKFRLFQFDIQL